MDETLVHHFTQSSNNSLNNVGTLVHPFREGSPDPSTGKVMVSVFWDAAGFLVVDNQWHTWVKVFRIFPEFRILRLTFHRNSLSQVYCTDRI